MNPFIRFLGTVLLLFPGMAMLQSQTILEQYVQLGLQNNLALKQEKQELSQSMARLKAAKSLFLPQS